MFIVLFVCNWNGQSSLIGVRIDFDELVLICTKNVNEFVLNCFGIRSSRFAWFNFFPGFWRWRWWMLLGLLMKERWMLTFLYKI